MKYDECSAPVNAVRDAGSPMGCDPHLKTNKLDQMSNQNNSLFFYSL